MSTNLDKIMWLNRRVPVGTHGGVRGRLFRVERFSYSIIYNHPSTFPIVCMWDKSAFSFLIKTVLISLQSNPEKNSHRLLVANLWLVKHPFFVSAILGISLYSKNPFIYRTCFGLLFFLQSHLLRPVLQSSAASPHPTAQVPRHHRSAAYCCPQRAAAKMHSVHGRGGACPRHPDFVRYRCPNYRNC